MNSFNDEDRDTSNHVHKMFIRMMTNSTKRDFMAGSYVYPRDDGRSVKLSNFLGSKILESNLLIAVTNRTLIITRDY